ncbi:MAG: 50S ribosomal protein L32 [Candidatus Nealsonbacteria bacterium]|nr:50S ribosomal protein L32 [Candidatus Nealsonbacteria bacterium]
MGGVPKQRHTKSRRNKRRSQIFLRSPALVICPHCKKPHLSHTVCRNCGYYQDREIIDVMKKAEKKKKKRAEKGLEPKTEEKEP